MSIPSFPNECCPRRESCSCFEWMPKPLDDGEAAKREPSSTLDDTGKSDV